MTDAVTTETPSAAISRQARMIARLRDEITVDEQRVADLMDDLNKAGHEIEKLRELLSEVWRHRNGGSALSSCWDRHVTEVLEGNGPA